MQPSVSSTLSASAARQRFAKFSTEPSKEMDALDLWEGNGKGLMSNPCLDVLRLATWAPRMLPTQPPPLSDATAEDSNDYTHGSREHSRQVPADSTAGVKNEERPSPGKETKSLLSDPEQLVVSMEPVVVIAAASHCWIHHAKRGS